MKMPDLTLSFSIQKKTLTSVKNWIEKNDVRILVLLLSVISIISFAFFSSNGLAVAYNDARSHLDIGRRVVEGLKPGLAQLGSVWLPLPHFLMIPTVWNDFFWHSGLAGALQSMISFVATGLLVYLYLKNLRVGMLARLFGVAIFTLNLNVIYLQATAMTELLLLATMTAGIYYLLHWFNDQNVLNLLKSGSFIMLSTLVRYDGWFLLFMASFMVFFHILNKYGYRKAEGTIVLFLTLGSLGVFLWFLWNLAIFGDPLYFVYGPFSAHAQQSQLEAAGELFTKYNLYLSLKTYFYAYVYNTYAYTAFLGIIGAVLFYTDRRIKTSVKLGATTLVAPFIFNVLALYLGHSVLFVQGIAGDTWFNVRYGMMLLPSVAIFGGYMVDRFAKARWTIIGLFAFTIFFAFANYDAVTIDDARVGSSQKNVSEVAGWLNENALSREGFVLISAASHDAIIFSSGLPMKKFIHEGTGKYWESATQSPDKWARWIILRTHDENDMTFREIKDAPGFQKYELIESYPFADIYQLKPEYLSTLITTPVFGKQK